ncbi:MAG: ribosome maturation factor RimP [Actinomycetales bacterium]
MARSSQDRVGDVVKSAVEGAGLVLEQVTVTPAGKRRLVRVVADLPDDETGSLDLDRLGEVSQAVNAAMDAAEPMGQTPYVLEVTSPGVSRPLTELRHWKRARGRLVEVSLDGAPPVTARVLDADADGLRLRVDGPRGTKPREVVAAWPGVGTGRVQVEFSRPEDSDAPDTVPDPEDLDARDSDSVDLETDEPDAGEAELDSAELDEAELDETELDEAELDGQAPDTSGPGATGTGGAAAREVSAGIHAEEQEG